MLKALKNAVCTCKGVKLSLWNMGIESNVACIFLLRRKYEGVIASGLLATETLNYRQGQGV